MISPLPCPLLQALQEQPQGRRAPRRACYGVTPLSYNVFDVAYSLLLRFTVTDNIKQHPFNIDEARSHPERIQTRDGRPVRVLAWDLKGKYPIAAAVPHNDDPPGRFFEGVHTYLPNGRRFDKGGDDSLDLVLRVEIVTLWINIFPSATSTGYGSGAIHTSKEEALRHAAGGSRVATVPITFPAQ